MAFKNDSLGPPSEKPLSPETWLWLQVANEQSVEQWTEWQEAVTTIVKKKKIPGKDVPVPVLPAPKVEMVPPSIKDVEQLVLEYRLAGGELDLIDELPAYGEHVYDYYLSWREIPEDAAVSNVYDLFALDPAILLMSSWNWFTGFPMSDIPALEDLDFGSIWSAFSNEPDLVSAILGASLSREEALGVLFAMEEDQSKSFAQILFPGQTTSGFPISELGEFGYESFLRNPMMVISDEEIQRRKLLECAWQEQENPGICLAQMHSIYLPSGRDVLPGGTYAPEYYPSVPMLPQWLNDSLGALIESPYIFGKVGWNFLKDIWLSDLDDVNRQNIPDTSGSKIGETFCIN